MMRTSTMPVGRGGTLGWTVAAVAIVLGATGAAAYDFGNPPDCFAPSFPDGGGRGNKDGWDNSEGNDEWWTRNSVNPFLQQSEVNPDGGAWSYQVNGGHGGWFEGLAAASRIRVKDFPVMCGSFKVPRSSLPDGDFIGANMLIALHDESSGVAGKAVRGNQYFSIAMTQEPNGCNDNPTCGYPDIADWNLGTGGTFEDANGEWFTTCINLYDQWNAATYNSGSNWNAVTSADNLYVAAILWHTNECNPSCTDAAYDHPGTWYFDNLAFVCTNPEDPLCNAGAKYAPSLDRFLTPTCDPATYPDHDCGAPDLTAADGGTYWYIPEDAATDAGLTCA